MQKNVDLGGRMAEKKLYIFDMDGTIYLGGQPFPFAIDFIKKLRANGKRVMFFTNNASHNPKFYLDKLTRLGYEPTAEEICTGTTSMSLRPFSVETMVLPARLA